MEVEPYMKANEIVMKEPYFGEVSDDMELDEDPATTFEKLENSDEELGNAFDCHLEKSSVNINATSSETFAYKAYEPDNIKMFLEPMQEEDAKVAKHAKMCFIPHSTAYEIPKQWNEGDGTVVPIGCIKSPSKINGQYEQTTAKLQRSRLSFLLN
ncbi:hypothetical protein G6F56_000699 [Rhizopus delemar]|nr:hypothetical protein G6F56_000699 [Rhizopus delemar]